MEAENPTIAWDFLYVRSYWSQTTLQGAVMSSKGGGFMGGVWGLGGRLHALVDGICFAHQSAS